MADLFRTARGWIAWRLYRLTGDDRLLPTAGDWIWADERRECERLNRVSPIEREGLF